MINVMNELAEITYEKEILTIVSIWFLYTVSGDNDR
jgi:hypothetical protein